MVCKNLKTNKYFNYKFTKGAGLVEINDGKDYKRFLPYDEWFENYSIVDKWRDLNESEHKYNEELEYGTISSS